MARFQIDAVDRLGFAGGVEVQGEGLVDSDRQFEVEHGELIEPPTIQFKGGHHAFRGDANATGGLHAEELNRITATDRRQLDDHIGVQQQLGCIILHR